MAAEPVDALDIVLRVAAAIDAVGGAYFMSGQARIGSCQRLCQ